MKIGLFTSRPLSLQLGAVKNRIELSDALRKLGWECHLFGYMELGLPTSGNSPTYRQRLKDYLVEHGDQYDVILYEYDTLPFPRKDLPARPLLVARPALLIHHLKKIDFPMPLLNKAKDLVKQVITGYANKRDVARRIDNADTSLQNCDVIQVQNTWDADEVRERFPDKRVIIVPNGITDSRLAILSAPLRDTPISDRGQVIAFVGTFDWRKGAVDLRAMLRNLVAEYPKVKLKILGAKGLFQTKEQIESFFPGHLRAHIEITLRFSPDELPGLLSDCRLGIFPSYFESFGFGALEMMAAGLPVVAYTTPGPADFIPEDLQIPAGNVAQFLEQIKLHLDSDELTRTNSERCLAIARQHDWVDIGRQAATQYLSAIADNHN